MWSIDDPDLCADLSKVQERINELTGQGSNNDIPGERDTIENVAELSRPESNPVEKCRCCCYAHCSVQFHNLYGSKSYCHSLTVPDAFQTEFVVGDNYENKGNVHFYSDEGDVRFEEADDPSMSSDNLTSYLMSVNSAFN